MCVLNETRNKQQAKMACIAGENKMSTCKSIMYGFKFQYFFFSFFFSMKGDPLSIFV